MNGLSRQRCRIITARAVRESNFAQVVACFPPGHADIPSLPPTTPPVAPQEKEMHQTLPNLIFFKICFALQMVLLSQDGAILDHEKGRRPRDVAHSGMKKMKKDMSWFPQFLEKVVFGLRYDVFATTWGGALSLLELMYGLSTNMFIKGSTSLARSNAIRDSSLALDRVCSGASCSALDCRIRHAWSHYKQLAWGMDELLPIAGRSG